MREVETDHKFFMALHNLGRYHPELQINVAFLSPDGLPLQRPDVFPKNRSGVYHVLLAHVAVLELALAQYLNHMPVPRHTNNLL